MNSITLRTEKLFEDMFSMPHSSRSNDNSDIEDSLRTVAKALAEYDPLATSVVSITYKGEGRCVIRYRTNERCDRRLHTFVTTASWGR